MAMKCVRHNTSGGTFRMAEETADAIVKMGFGSYASKEEWKKQGRLYYSAPKNHPLGGKVLSRKEQQ